VTDQGLVAGRLVELPPPRTRLPREKPLPRPRAPTRWEAYAKEKGIVKRKRSQRVWDQDAGEWRGRHGYDRVGDAADVAVIEAKPWETTGVEDPFALQRREKRARVAAQEGRQVKNLSAAAKRGGAGALPPGVSLSSMLPLDGRGGGGGAPIGARLGKDGLKQAAAVARLSTASMGASRRLAALCLLARHRLSVCALLLCFSAPPPSAPAGGALCSPQRAAHAPGGALSLWVHISA
jgi:regulator of ribosome biosynthesis